MAEIREIIGGEWIKSKNSPEHLKSIAYEVTMLRKNYNVNILSIDREDRDDLQSTVRLIAYVELSPRISSEVSLVQIVEIIGGEWSSTYKMSKHINKIQDEFKIMKEKYPESRIISIEREDQSTNPEVRLIAYVEKK